MHVPVLLKEVLDGLKPKPGDTIIDATFGEGGHAFALLERIRPGGRLLAIDRDPKVMTRGRARAVRHNSEHSITFALGNFSELTRIAHDHGFPHPHAILFDLGISLRQIEDPSYGIGFQIQGPLDMRINPKEGGESAAEIVNTFSEDELVRLFQRYADERSARPIARAIVRARKRARFFTTHDLVHIVEEAVGGRRGRLHPATKVFLALRVAVNNEVANLERALPQAIDLVASGGRVAAIAFQSLEDRIVKQAFLAGEQAGKGRRVTKKPIRPSREEVLANPRARSALLRLFEKI